MYSVVLVDDEHLILEGLRLAFPWEKMNCIIVGTASDGTEGLALVRKLRPQILLTDIRMPNIDGLAMLAALRSEFPQMQVTVLTAFRDFEYAHKAINLGVCRYLLKPSRMNELEEAVREMTARVAMIESAQQPRPEIAPAVEAADESEAGSFIVREALAFIREHCSEHLRLSDVADHVYVSQWHLSKLINSHTGQGFFDLLGQMRIEKAKLLMTDPSMRIHDIADSVGYSDVAHFSKSFKKIVGKTPGEYRDNVLGR